MSIPGMEQQSPPREDDGAWLKLGGNACRHAGIDHERLDVLVTWDEEYCSNAVYAVDRRDYLKVFGPSVPNQFHVEHAMLEALAGREDIPSPKIIAVGELPHAAPYLIITGVPGKTAEDIWEKVPRKEQLAIAGELGAIVAAINDLPETTLVHVEQRFGGRSASASHFRTRLIEEIKATDAVSARFRSAFIDFLEGEARRHLEQATTICHRELTHNHIYLGRKESVWSVSGIIDWADAMRGPEEWDLSFIWFWTFTRDHDAMHRFLAARYGDAGPPAGLSRRCLGAILQTYEWPDLWDEIVQQCTGSEPDPIQTAAGILFPDSLFI